MSIKLLALDLDGTIVTEFTQISPQVQHAIRKAMEKGVYITLATGREYQITVEFARQLQVNAPIICYQGALIQDYHTNRPLMAHYIPADLSRRIIRFARAHKLPMVLYNSQMSYTELPSSLMRQTFQQANTPIVVVHNLLGLLLNRLPLKFLFIQPEDENAAVLNLLTQEFGTALTITTTWQTMVEATIPHISKGEALRQLAKHLNVPLSQTMAIGDQDNDISMIEAAGLGVAIGNATSGVKQVADAVAPPITNDGVAWAIETFVLGTTDD